MNPKNLGASCCISQLQDLNPKITLTLNRQCLQERLALRSWGPRTRNKTRAFGSGHSTTHAWGHTTDWRYGRGVPTRTKTRVRWGHTADWL